MDMKDILAFCLCLIPSISYADKEVYLVNQWSSNTRIVLQEKSCLVHGLTGSRAVVQRADGAYIRGCWYYVDGGKYIRIDWDIPNHPGDFAVIEVEKFHVVEE